MWGLVEQRGNGGWGGVSGEGFKDDKEKEDTCIGLVVLLFWKGDKRLLGSLGLTNGGDCGEDNKDEWLSMDKGTRLSVLVGVLLGPRGMEHMFFGSFVLLKKGRVISWNATCLEIETSFVSKYKITYPLVPFWNPKNASI